jgi:HEAT repeat protein
VTGSSAVARAADLAALGHLEAVSPADVARLERACADDPDARVRAAALGALARAAPAAALWTWPRAVTDDSTVVRRRAAELAPTLAMQEIATQEVVVQEVVAPLVSLLGDRDVIVVEAAAWALGELGAPACATGAVDALADVVVHHRDALAREAAVAALGALGDDAGLPAILAACTDKPAVRRRAVLALAPFDGTEVDAAIDTALDDRDWQVRQAAEDLRAEDLRDA